MPSVPANRSFERSNKLQARLHDLVPGGAHTYSRGSDQYPEHMTPVLVRGQAAGSGTPTATSTSSTAWACGR